MTAIQPTERPLCAPSLEEDYALLKTAARDAGELALTYFRQQILVNRKADGSEVSEADLAVDTALKLDLLTRRPDYGWLSEETEDNPERLKHRRVWMVDPIDGTNAFLRHVAEWTVSVALVEDGVPVLGVVFNPATQEFFHAMRGKGAFLNDAPIAASDKMHAGRRAVDRERRPVQEEDLERALARGQLALGELGGLSAGAGRLRKGGRHHLAVGEERMGPRRRGFADRGGRRRHQRSSRRGASL